MNATDFTDLLKNPRSCMGVAGQIQRGLKCSMKNSQERSSAKLFESVESVESVAFLSFSPIRSEGGGKLLSTTSDYTRRIGRMRSF